jgi:hypothetical protein
MLPVKTSTSNIMHYLFGDDLARVMPLYDAAIDELIAQNPMFSYMLSQCRGRTMFLWTYFPIEYGYYATCGELLPDALQILALGYSLISLAVGVDDDIVDELRDDPLKMMEAACTAALLRNKGYRILADSPCHEAARLVQEHMGRYLQSVTQQQMIDSIFLHQTCRAGFRLADYLDGTYKTGCVFDYGFSLGQLLGGVEPSGQPLAKCLGMALQLLDDVLDLPEDHLAFPDYSMTYPLYLVRRAELLTPVFEIVDNELAAASCICQQFRYPAKALALVSGLGRAADEIRRQHDL